MVGPISLARGTSRVQVEPVHRRGVAGQHLLDLARIDALERPAQRLAVCGNVPSWCG